MEFWDKKLGLGIKLRRKEMNIRQVDLAERLHVEPTTISRWETGSGSPDISILPNLAYELGTTVDDLLGNKKRNKEDEIKKEKISFISFVSMIIKIVMAISIIFLLFYYFFYVFLRDVFYDTFYINAKIKIIIIIFVNFTCFISMNSKTINKKLIIKTYKYKYNHKYPVGYKFDVKDNYLNFLNVIIFFFALLFDVLLILG